MSLGAIQRRLAELYDIDVDESVDDFVCDEETARAVVGDAVERGEVLLVAEEEDGVSVGLYVAESAVASLTDPAEVLATDRAFEAFCLATEGVSHFVYLLFRAKAQDAVTQLELELQAEVDKYATALLCGNGVGVIRERSPALRRQLFSNVEYLDTPGSSERERYELATKMAARFVERLERDHVERGDVAGLLRALRRFYRLGAREKLEAAEGG